MSVTIFPIRHHGLGCAKALYAALEDWQPDCVLIEGPPEANALLHYVAQAEMVPPVALLAYVPEDPERAVFYPFAEYSPEWQALCYGVRRGCATQFFDCPLAYTFAQTADVTHVDDNAEETETEHAESALATEETIQRSPLDDLAILAGFRDGEQWWDALVEESGESVFAAVLEAMSALREAFPETRQRDLQREAYMRLQIRAAEKQGFQRIAVVCGAWHAPALQMNARKKEDEAWFKGAAKSKVTCTWVAWTHAHLTQASGYGAGIAAPRYYAHQWQHADDDGLQWVADMAQVLRAQHFEVSAAHMMEVWRLARATAQLRGMPRASLHDYLDALQAVVLLGDESALAVVHQALLVGEQIGQVPDDVPRLPLLDDVETQYKRLRLNLYTGEKTLALDLRKPTDLARSVFFHRLRLLGVRWVQLHEDYGYRRGKGTFAESWTLHYQPESHLALVEKAVYGNTLAAACQHYGQHQIDKQESLAALSALLQRVMPADLPELVLALSRAIEQRSVDSSDVLAMLWALPELCQVLRYGTVRGVADNGLLHVVETLLVRLVAGGAFAAMNIDDEQAARFFDALREADYALAQLDHADMMRLWQDFVQQLMRYPTVHGRLQGYALRLQFDQQQLSMDESAEAMAQALSPAHEAMAVAQWLEGFLYEPAKVLLLHDRLWHLLLAWVDGLSDERFVAVLPLLRRTFAQCALGERRQLRDKVQRPKTRERATPQALNTTYAQSALQTMAQLLGLSKEGEA